MRERDSVLDWADLMTTRSPSFREPRGGPFRPFRAVRDVQGALHDLLRDDRLVSALDPQRDEQRLHLRSELVLTQDLGDAVALLVAAAAMATSANIAVLEQLLQGELQMPERLFRLFAAEQRPREEEVRLRVSRRQTYRLRRVGDLALDAVPTQSGPPTGSGGWDPAPSSRARGASRFACGRLDAMPRQRSR
jgi:hypothetical protein